MYSGHAAQADSRTGRDRPRNRAGSSGIWRMATSGGSDAGAPVVLALVPTCFAPPGGQRRVRQSAQDGRGADATGVDALLPSRSQPLACLLDVTQPGQGLRSEEHTSELKSLMRISYAVFCLKKNNNKTTSTHLKTK